MQGHIAKLNCRYRVYGDQALANGVSSRLDRIVKNHVVQTYENALEQVYGDDEKIIVLRRIRSKLFVSVNHSITDIQIARRWGERLATDVVRSIEGPNRVPGEVIEFDNQADFVSHFIADVLQDRVWSRWYYGSFRYLQNQSRPEIIFNVLRDNSAHIPRVLALLYARGSLGQLNDCLEPTALKVIWALGRSSASDATKYVLQPTLNEALDILRSSMEKSALQQPIEKLDDGLLSRLEKTLQNKPWIDGAYVMSLLSNYFSGISQDANSLHDTASDSDRSKARELFIHVFRLVEKLNLWSDKPASIDSLFANYGADLFIDWMDTASLTNAVIDMLHYLAANGYLKTFVGFIPGDVQSDLTTVLENFDWLHTNPLQETMVAVISGYGGSSNANRRLTPRQQAIVNDLASIMKNNSTLSQSVEIGESHALAMFIYAALINRFPQWAGDEFTTRLIENLAILRCSELPDSELKQLLSQSNKALIQNHKTSISASTANGVVKSAEFIAKMGNSAMELLNTLLGESGRGETEHSLETVNAGLFLLLRAVNDLGLAKLIGELQPPDKAQMFLPIFMLSLFQCMAAYRDNDCKSIDPGLLLLAGLDADTTPEKVTQIWSGVSGASLHNYQDALMRKLMGQRLFSGNELHIHQISMEPETADQHMRQWMLAGDEHGQIWPMARFVNPDKSYRELVESFYDRWKNIKGIPPTRIVVDKQLASYCSDCEAQWHITVVEEEDSTQNQNYHKARQLLIESLQTLNVDNVGLPETDMTIAITAIAVLKAWARWLRKFSGSSIPYILNNFIHRAGTISVNEASISVAFNPAPLDVIIEMAGYLEKIDIIDWLDRRSVTFRIQK